MAARDRRRERPARTAPAAPPPALAPAARALAVALAATLALRALAALAPGRWLWGLDVARDLAPAWRWLPLLACALALVPAIARALAARLPASPRGVAALGIALALLAAALVLALPDEVRLTGDAGMRHAAFARDAHPEAIARQATPGDLWLHWALPRRLSRDPNDLDATEPVYRALGALLALANGLFALALARARGARGAAALAVMATAGWTATLALFTGYGKGLVELAAIALAVAAALVAIARGGRGLAALGLLVAAGLALHRSALVLLPAWLAALALVTARARAAAWRRPGAWVALLAPLAVLAWIGPVMARTLANFDRVKHLAAPGTPAGAFAAQLLAPAHVVDVANLLLLLVPALPLAVVLAWPRPGVPRAERALLAALALPALLVALVVRPQQGLFRDWDMYAPAGVALAAWLALRAADVIETAGAAWLAVPLALLATTTSAQWLAHQGDTVRAPARLQAILAGPPTRSDAETAIGDDRLGMWYLDRGDAPHAAELCSLAVVHAPNPRLMVETAMALMASQRYAEAQGYCLRAAAAKPDFTLAWKGVASTSSALGDRGNLERAVVALRQLDPGDPTTRDAEQWLLAHPATPPH